MGGSWDSRSFSAAGSVRGNQRKEGGEEGIHTRARTLALALKARFGAHNARIPPCLVKYVPLVLLVLY